MNTMTGATNDQVEDAVEREWKRATERGIARGDASFETYFFRHLPRMLQHAADLVTADKCIVRRDDLRAILDDYARLEGSVADEWGDEAVGRQLIAYNRLRAAISGPELPLPESDVRRNDEPYIETC